MKISLAHIFLSTAALVASQGPPAGYTGPYGPPAGVFTTIDGTVYILPGATSTAVPVIYTVDGKVYSAGPGIGAPSVLPTDQPQPLPTATTTSSSSSSSSEVT